MTISDGKVRATERQMLIAKLLSDGYTYNEIALHCDRATATIRIDVERLALQIDSDFPPRSRVVLWHRLLNGINVLTGEKLGENTPQSVPQFAVARVKRQY
jgi:hypothetical protein